MGNETNRAGSPEHLRDRLVSRAAEESGDLADLVRLYYRYVPPEEVNVDRPVNLAGAVRSHYELAEQRVLGRPLVRVLNPTEEQDGWSCAATVVQVVTDDMPYLVDSVVAELGRSGFTVQRLAHPIVVVRRDLTGTLQEVLPAADSDDPPENTTVESWMHLEIDRIGDDDRERELESTLTSVLGDVREVVEDADKMVSMAESLAEGLDVNGAGSLPRREVGTVSGLLRWLASGHFTFLGYRHFEVVSDAAEPTLRGAPESGLGVLRRDSLTTRRLSETTDTAATAITPALLVLTQARVASTVHRSAYPYYVGLKTFDKNGEVSGEHRFVGLLASSALHEDVLDIPVISERVRAVMHRAGFPLESHSGQQILEIAQNYPRAELFSTDVDTLYDIVTGVLALADRKRLRLFLRPDPYGRFYSCLVYLPRDRYTTRSRLAIQDALLDELGGRSIEYSARIGETELARVHFMVQTEPSQMGQMGEVDTTALQQELAEAVRTWDDRLVDALLAEQDRTGEAAGYGPESTTEYGQRLGESFPEAYKEDFTAAQGLEDLRRLEGVAAENGGAETANLDMSFYVPAEAEPGEVRFKLFLAGERVTLTQVLPVLQHMDVEVVDERPYEVHLTGDTRCWIFDFGLRVEHPMFGTGIGSGELPDSDTLDRLRVRFQDAFAASWRGDAEVDSFNALVLRAGLDWRQAAVLRAYTKYQRQAGTPYSQNYIEDVVLDHTDIAAGLVRLFELRSDLSASEGDRERDTEALTGEITAMIDEVTSLDADRILRSLLTMISSTLRTNYRVTDADAVPRPYLSLKLEPTEIPDLPEPRPRYEVFVYSPRFEGVHLRFGEVARGGLRWSDRREDFRTEILGLVKAQAVKNAVIVPVGSKGGFVLKRPPAPTGDAGADREATQQEGIACYRMLICGMLDLTDNLVDGKAVPPPDVVRHDGDDTYLVVAADKGTATFSDIANEVANSYGYWLGDAFASGGSVGYDHKDMGITAKGAWESVKRHFRELGVDTQTQDFTVVGIGDMAGDVFGNGMLLSEHIRLVAAFNHMHVFVDPNPDAETTFAERTRLFELPRSSWNDYDRSLISEGGGIWLRSEKSIPVSEQMRTALGIDAGVTKMAPNDLIHAILLAPVDLFWNGGIGTYVKSSQEAHAAAGDKGNDAVRVDGEELRARVVGEGGNLGMTQRGRIEYARNGGKLNTDALDNSAGVDCSDHEVNIKILLDQLVAQGELDREQRNELLMQMTDEVASLVLSDNYEQNQVLGVSRAHAAPMVTVHARLLSDLERRTGLDRELEALPTPGEFRQLAKDGKGLTSPELASLLAHVKLDLKDQVLATELPDAEVFARRLPEYFPQELRPRFTESIQEHPLHRQITTTLLVNDVVDGGGITFAFRLAEELSATATDAVRAFFVAMQVFELPALWRRIADLDNEVPTEVQDGMMLQTRRLLDRASRWFLSNRPQPLAVGAEINRFARNVRELAPMADDFLRGSQLEAVHARGDDLLAQGVPEPLARRVAVLLDLYGLLDAIEVAELSEHDVDAETTPRSEGSHVEAAELYYAVSDHLDIDTMLVSVSELERGNRWHALARLALRDDLYGSLRAITLDVLRYSEPGDSPEEKVAKWEETNASRLGRARTALEEISRVGKLDLATLSVAARQVRSMVR